MSLNNNLGRGEEISQYEALCVCVTLKVYYRAVSIKQRGHLSKIKIQYRSDVQSMSLLCTQVKEIYFHIEFLLLTLLFTESQILHVGPPQCIMVPYLTSNVDRTIDLWFWTTWTFSHFRFWTSRLSLHGYMSDSSFFKKQICFDVGCHWDDRRDGKQLVCLWPWGLF